MENEICPVYLGRFSGPPVPEATEVGEWELLDWAAFRERQETEGDAWSPLCREQARMIEVWNKADLLPADERDEAVSDARRASPPAVLVSAVGVSMRTS